MKAVVYERYGPPDVLELREIEMPAVRDGEVRVRVHAASVNPADWYFLTGTPRLLRLVSGPLRPKNKILGRDLAGRVEAVGRNVARFRPGDEVFGESIGTFAEYVCVSEEGIAMKPASLTFEQAAAVPLAANTALQGLRDVGGIRADHRVLINGASGGVGSFAVQIAKSFGAEVTGVCSARNAGMVRSIGADHVIDYTREDFTRSGRRYDLMLDLVASRPLSDCRRVLSPRGVYISSAGGGGLAWLFKVLLASLFVRQKLTTFVAKPSREDLMALRELLESGAVTPVIDRRYPLSEVPDAIRYIGEGHARGKVVVVV